MAFTSTLLRAECEYLSRRIALAENIYSAMLARLADPERRLTTLMTRMRMLSNMGRFEETVADGVACLKLLGVVSGRPKRSTSSRRCSAYSRCSALPAGPDEVHHPARPADQPDLFLSGGPVGAGLLDQREPDRAGGVCDGAAVPDPGNTAALRSAMRRTASSWPRAQAGRTGQTGVRAWCGGGREGWRPCVFRSGPLHVRGVLRPLGWAAAERGHLSQTGLGLPARRGLPYAGAAANMFLYYLPVVGTPLSDFLAEARDIVEVARQTEQSRTIMTVEILRRWTESSRAALSTDRRLFCRHLRCRRAQQRERERSLSSVRDLDVLFPGGLRGRHRTSTACLATTVERLFRGLLRIFHRTGAGQVAEGGPRQDRWRSAFRRHQQVVTRHAGTARRTINTWTCCCKRWKPVPWPDRRGPPCSKRPSRTPGSKASSRTPPSRRSRLAEHLESRGDSAGASRHFRNARLWYHQWGCLAKVGAIVAAIPHVRSPPQPRGARGRPGPAMRRRFWKRRGRCRAKPMRNDWWTP